MLFISFFTLGVMQYLIIYWNSTITFFRNSQKHKNQPWQYLVKRFCLLVGLTITIVIVYLDDNIIQTLIIMRDK